MFNRIACVYKGVRIKIQIEGKDNLQKPQISTIDEEDNQKSQIPDFQFSETTIKDKFLQGYQK